MTVGVVNDGDKDQDPDSAMKVDDDAVSVMSEALSEAAELRREIQRAREETVTVVQQASEAAVRVT